MENHKLIITPKTKVGELLDVYPQLEGLLIELAPTFKKLRNPVLRRTIARITSLQQVAIVGGLPLDKIINTLRKEIGQEMDHSHPTNIENTAQPDWFDAVKIVTTLDARPAIAAGQHPLDPVFSGLSEMKENGVFELITPFVPAPLLDKVKAKGYLVWTKQESGIFKNYFVKE
jgi:uncharacterized protein (DUF2249 family)